MTLSAGRAGVAFGTAGNFSTAGAMPMTGHWLAALGFSAAKEPRAKAWSTVALQSRVLVLQVLPGQSVACVATVHAFATASGSGLPAAVYTSTSLPRVSDCIATVVMLTL